MVTKAQVVGLLSSKLLLVASPSNLIIIKTIVTSPSLETSPWDKGHLDHNYMNINLCYLCASSYTIIFHLVLRTEFFHSRCPYVLYIHLCCNEIGSPSCHNIHQPHQVMISIITHNFTSSS